VPGATVFLTTASHSVRNAAVLGDLAGAKANLQRAVAIAEASLGPDHPNVAIFRRNLDLVLNELGE
jgi:hypothetical protein